MRSSQSVQHFRNFFSGRFYINGTSQSSISDTFSFIFFKKRTKETTMNITSYLERVGERYFGIDRSQNLHLCCLYIWPQFFKAWYLWLFKIILNQIFMKLLFFFHIWIFRWSEKCPKILVHLMHKIYCMLYTLLSDAQNIYHLCT